ncbi:VOC family protein [Micromonospora costi]|uniref:VOC family protein n=1 Tax=Micromonospora costi TaxID=1530042 RepID=A0A3A9ZNN9_9ACTN|nr:VOC family protein [Micromonospora costi]RKN49809.1 VOC family protein [Micromonospora costi]
MASRLNPYVNFPGTAREAMEFYHRIFGGSLRMNTFGEFGSQEPTIANQIMHAMLETDAGFTLMASDLPPGMPHDAGNTVSISISGDDADDLRRYWEQLSEGGVVSMPLEKQMWGDEFGMCTDRFGIQWMVDITPPQG